MRVLVTGITGFVGSHFADHLRDRVQLIDCDFRDLSSVQNLLDQAVPEGSWREAQRVTPESDLTAIVDSAGHVTYKLVSR